MKLWFWFIVLGFWCLVSVVLSHDIGRIEGYKQGQLDFQRGQVEWLLVGPDEVHHIQKEK